MLLTSSFVGRAFTQTAVAAPSRPSNASRQVTCMAKKKGVRIIVTLECTEARGEGGTPSRYTTQKVRTWLDVKPMSNIEAPWCSFTHDVPCKVTMTRNAPVSADLTYIIVTTAFPYRHRHRRLSPLAFLPCYLRHYSHPIPFLIISTTEQEKHTRKTRITQIQQVPSPQDVAQRDQVDAFLLSKILPPPLKKGNIIIVATETITMYIYLCKTWC